MNTRQRLGLSLAPLLLRIALAVVFIWAGAVKLMTTMPVKGQDAAILANMGIGLKTGPLSPAVIPAPSKPSDPAAPAGMQPPERPLPAPGAEPRKPGNPSRAEPPLRPEAKPIIVTQREAAPSAMPMPLLALAAPASAPASASAAPAYTADQFPDAQEVLAVYGIAIGLHKASIPGGPAGSTMALVPAAFGQGSVPIYLAWAAGITELAGGALVLIGLFTRFWSFAIACVMLVAMWMTQIGPAIQSGDTFLFILPNHPWNRMDLFVPFMFQFTLFMMALALTILGAGSASVDGAPSAVSGGSAGPAKKPA